MTTTTPRSCKFAHAAVGSVCVLLWFVSFTTTHALVPSSIRFRRGRPTDEPVIASTLAKQLMNPLGVQGNRFVVAQDESLPASGVVGWAQIRPLGSAQPDSTQYNAPPGSKRATTTVEDDVDDELWDEFEQDESIRVPVGWASLPWTKEYRAFAQASEKQRNRRERLLQRQKEQETTDPLLYELASVYVKPEYRGQGIGKELVRKVLGRHELAGRSLSDVYLLTLATTAAWYQDSFGFCKVEDEKDVPAQMAFEMAAGKLITKLIGAQLCCMRGPSSLK